MSVNNILLYLLQPNNKEVKKSGYFYEQFEADDAYERIDVPEFNGGRHGQFVHDFRIVSL